MTFDGNPVHAMDGANQQSHLSSESTGIEVFVHVLLPILQQCSQHPGEKCNLKMQNIVCYHLALFNGPERRRKC